MKSKTQYILYVILFIVVNIVNSLVSLLIQETNGLKIGVTATSITLIGVLSFLLIPKAKEHLQEEKSKQKSTEGTIEQLQSYFRLGMEQLEKIIALWEQGYFDLDLFQQMTRKMSQYLSRFLDIDTKFSRNDLNYVTFNRISYSVAFFPSLGNFTIEYQKGDTQRHKYTNETSEDLRKTIIEFVKNYIGSK